jgi:hypothetical protein
MIGCLLLLACSPTPEPTRLVAAPPTATLSAPEAATATPPPLAAATQPEQPYPAPEVSAVDGPYPGPSGTPDQQAPTAGPTSPPVPQVIVPTPSQSAATVTGVIYSRSGDQDRAPLQYARVFLARRLKNEAGQPSFMVSLSKTNAPTSITDGEGRFAFGDVEPENYALIIEFGQQLALARDLGTNTDVVLVAEAGQITDIGEIVVTTR